MCDAGFAGSGVRPFDELSRQVIGCALEVHRTLGPGLLESTYEECLCYELMVVGLRFERQAPLPVEYKAVVLPCGYRVDVLVENQLIIELKSIEVVKDIHVAQVLTYMRLARIPVGLLINFNVKLLRQGIRRLVL
jgi:GxxExxY protein